MPTFGSLFAGIGGIDLGLERAGWTCRWQVEIDEFCRHVLEHHWPDVPRYGDIRGIDWSGVERVDLLAGGFPCQPVSHAGRRLAQDDARWLWPEFLRAIRALRPDYVLVENVPGLLDRGFGDVIGGLAASGYDAEWDCIPAAAVGAPHIRDRFWLVAHSEGRELGIFDWSPRPTEAIPGSRSQALADPDRPRLEGRELQPERPDQRPLGASGMADPDFLGWGGRARHLGPRRWREPADGGWWLTEPDVGRVAHGIPRRVDRLRALGNAVVPQVVEVIGAQLLRAIESAA